MADTRDLIEKYGRMPEKENDAVRADRMTAGERVKAAEAVPTLGPAPSVKQQAQELGRGFGTQGVSETQTVRNQELSRLAVPESPGYAGKSLMADYYAANGNQAGQQVESERGKTANEKSVEEKYGGSQAPSQEKEQTQEKAPEKDRDR